MNKQLLGAITALLACAFVAGGAAQAADKPFEPYSGQPGKDVVWVPTAQPISGGWVPFSKRPD